MVSWLPELTEKANMILENLSRVGNVQTVYLRRPLLCLLWTAALQTLPEHTKRIPASGAFALAAPLAGSFSCPSGVYGLPPPFRILRNGRLEAILSPLHSQLEASAPPLDFTTSEDGNTLFGSPPAPGDRVSVPLKL